MFKNNSLAIVILIDLNDYDFNVLSRNNVEKTKCPSNYIIFSKTIVK